jgi:hypothetical protein
MFLKSNNLYKLFTKEDHFNIHKLLGISTLAHYLYRFFLLIIYRDTYLNKDKHTPFFLLLHSLLSLTSLIFHIPKNRIKGKPMIYPEFRLHSIIFALRSSICSLCFYYNLPLYFNIIVCFITLFLADIITLHYKSITKTMRNMPYNKNIPETEVKKINRIYGEMQILATLFMLGNINTSFTPMFSIQIASFLMTLVRKSIIGENSWHLLYMTSLIMNIFSFITLDIKQFIIIYFLSYLFIFLRFENNFNKYISWFICFSLFYYFNLFDNYSYMCNNNYIINGGFLYYFIISKDKIKHFLN